MFLTSLRPAAVLGEVNEVRSQGAKQSDCTFQGDLPSPPKSPGL